ncbi:MAG: hypothetical protein ACK5AZ_19480 [Bryobacteraceae bacterium]
MRLLLILAVISCASAQDAREIVRRSVSRDQSNWQRLRDYTFVERVERRKLDRDGRVASKESETFDVIILGGQPYQRKIAHNDSPLGPAEERKASAKFGKLMAELDAETPEQRQKRIESFERRRRESRAFLQEVPDLFHLRLLGEEIIDGRRMWVIEALPRPEYRPKHRNAAMLQKFRGKLWVEKNEYQWVKLEAEAIETVSFGWFIARLGKGSAVEFQQTRLKDELWAPSYARIRVNGRLALVKRLAGEAEVTYRNHRKFQSDSRILPAEP